ncbi:AbrB/MazE/SpoVT family DNA-binding domain-containing protein [Teredinibacter turnerae]|uniref:SpoVT/AbrB domain protein n=1 Tax=Teredinibacter turnerae (strain ATCC 39867 / T7901) TaxID=377629 RepID=C5BSM0_TERTT|nr:AbrB/MazE/SpoVT family DNA-binding domain-containing protein [Teredinibacter turnerae]ACR12685.1 SpoVT/AbrB domain protein [Teredinibacter turnerae T7901]
MANIEIQKWGNSAAIRLNKGLLNQLSCDIGNTFEVTLKDGGVFLKPVREAKYSLAELLENCPDESLKMDEEDDAWLNSNPEGGEHW